LTGQNYGKPVIQLQGITTETVIVMETVAVTVTIAITPIESYQNALPQIVASNRRGCSSNNNSPGVADLI
jgi:hypothetical protein